MNSKDRLSAGLADFLRYLGATLWCGGIALICFVIGWCSFGFPGLR